MDNQYGSGLYQDGTFYFTNPGLFKSRDKEGNLTGDFVALWNNREYIFKAKTTVPLVIPNETPEAVQNIRKLFAKKYAQAWFHQTPRYKKLVQLGKNLPATYDEDAEFKDVIQQCLTPLPKAKLETRDLPRETEDKYIGSKAVKPGQDLNQMFADYEPPVLGEM